MKILRSFYICAAAGLTCFSVWTCYSQTNNLTFTSNKGVVYSNVTVIKVEPDGVTFVFNDNRTGGGKIAFTNMPASLQARFGYDAQKAAAFETEQAQAKVRRQAQERAAQALRQSQLEAQQREAQQRAAQLAQIKQAAEQARKETQWQTLAEAAQNPHDEMYEEAARADNESYRTRKFEDLEKRIKNRTYKATWAEINVTSAELAKLRAQFANAADRRVMVRTNLDEAIEWYSKTAELGDKVAKENFAKMTAAQKRLTQWQAQYDLEQAKAAQRRAQNALDEISSELRQIQREQQDQADKLQQIKQHQN